jgi:hypothetical protein
MENRGKDLMQIRKALLKKSIDENQSRAIRYLQVSRENIAYFKFEFLTSRGHCYKGTIPLDVVHLDSVVKQMLKELYDYHVSERFRAEQELGMIDRQFPTTEDIP